MIGARQLGPLVLLAAALSCAHGVDPVEAAVLQKTTADGVVSAYLDHCEIVVRPRCEAEDLQAQQDGKPQSKQQRIACLRPCDSASAKLVQARLDNLRTSQTALFLMLQQHPTDEELAASRDQVAEDVTALLGLLRELGVFDKLGKAFGQ